MDQKPLSSRDRTARRRMDGVGSSVTRGKVGAPLDLRRPVSDEPKQPVGPVKISPARPIQPSSPAPARQAPVRAPQTLPAPPARKETANYDDPLHGLLDDHYQPAHQQAEAHSAPPPVKKKSHFWRSFWKFMGVVLILLFILSAGMFVYLNYFSGQ